MLKEGGVSGHVEHSYFYLINSSEKLINFKRLYPQKQNRFDLLGEYDLPLLYGKSIYESLNKFCETFSSIKNDDILTDRNQNFLSDAPSIVHDFLDYIIKLSPNIYCSHLYKYWPPLFPQINNSSKAFLALLISILTKVSNPGVFLNVLENLFPILWTSKNSFFSTEISGFCRCLYDNKKNDHYAIYTCDGSLELYEVVGYNVNLIKRIPVHKFDISNTQVVGYSMDSKQVVKFEPLEQDQKYLWCELDNSAKNRVPLHYFFSSLSRVVPDRVINIFYEAFVNDNMFYIKSLMQETEIKPKIWDSLFPIFLYAGKGLQLVAHVLSSVFSSDSSFDYTYFTRQSPLKCLYAAVGKYYFKDYFRDFFIKIVELINCRNDVDFTADPSSIDTGNVQNLVFSILKYITQSFSSIPSMWRCVLNIIRNYTMIHFNSKSVLFVSLSGFIGVSIICGFLEDPQGWIPDLPAIKKGGYPALAKILLYPFCCCKFSGKLSLFSSLNSKLEKHFFPKYYEFLIQISDFPRDVVPMPPSKENLADHLCVVIPHFINTEFWKIHKKNVGDHLNSNQRGSTVCGWNLCSILITFFVHEFDECSVNSINRHKAVVGQTDIQLPHMKNYDKTIHKLGRNTVTSSKRDIQTSDDMEVQEDEPNIPKFCLPDPPSSVIAEAAREETIMFHNPFSRNDRKATTGPSKRLPPSLKYRHNMSKIFILADYEENSTDTIGIFD